MNYNSIKKLEEDVKMASAAKDGCLTWSEFLDFFFLKDATFQDRIDSNDWWNKIDPNGKQQDQKGSSHSQSNGNVSENEDYAVGGEKKSRKQRLMSEFKEVPMTPALEMLLNSRKVKTEQEVEKEFNLRQKGITSVGQNQTKKKKAFQITEILDEDQNGE